VSLYFQYHNGDKEGLECLFSDDDRFAIYTRRPHVKNARGTVLVIVGVGKPRAYFLWEAFEIDEVEPQNDGVFVAHGPGWRLCPPQRLEGADFDAFKSSCANLIGFRKIDDLPYSTTLKKMANKYRSGSAKAMQPFLQGLLGLLKQGTEDYETVLQQMQTPPSAPKSKPLKKAVARPMLKKSPSPMVTVPPQKPSKKSLPESQQDGDQTKNLRALSIRQPHAEAIMRGIKTIEFRTVRTKIRGRVQIYASLGRYPAELEAEMLKEYSIKDVSCDDLRRGVLIGTVEISDCTEDYGEFHWHLEKPKRATRLVKPKKQPQPMWFNPF
jgi:hypothetical protein